MGVLKSSLKTKLFYGSKKVKKAYIGDTKIYSAGNIVTYYVDGTAVHTEEVDSDASCLSPTSFTPTKDGWTFVGWREDTTANGTVLTEKLMGDTPITLYAVFEQTVTVTYYNNSTTASSTNGKRYYNNNNTANPSFTLTQATRSGWTARGWSVATTGNGAISYNNATAFTRDSNITLYGMYQAAITCTFKSYNSTQTANGTRYYNSNGTTVNASVTVPTGATMTGWTWRGWSAANSTTGNTTVGYANGATISNLTTGYTYYGLYHVACNLYTVSNGSTKTNAGTRYYNSSGNYTNPTFTVASPTKSGYTFQGWSTGATSTAVSYSSISNLSITTNTTLYAVWKSPDKVYEQSYPSGTDGAWKHIYVVFDSSLYDTTATLWSNASSVHIDDHAAKVANYYEGVEVVYHDTGTHTSSFTMKNGDTYDFMVFAQTGYYVYAKLTLTGKSMVG